ncbi:MerR family transcriptional regulator [Streptosporangium sp. NPDC051022]|uniref:helix-turn-helix domain-containing protein n=1 Tax=Streptosporangium sp. NPDC051022 TaxID=3155752 RepID=UPI003431AE26
MEWTIGELAERASAALSPTAQLNGRVRDTPNERLIRWYATIGLLDPPSARRGRVALYSRRHLLQLIAVKRRQAEGRTIAEIQAELAGATDQALEAVAGLQDAASGGNGEPDRTAPRTGRPRFWAGPSATAANTTADATANTAADAASGPLAAPAAATGTASAPAGTTTRPAASEPAASEPAASEGAPRAAAPRGAPQAPPHTRSAPSPSPVAVHGVRLAAGVTLLLDGGGRTPSPEALAEIGAASQALLSVLREHDLVPANPQHQQDQEGNQP